MIILNSAIDSSDGVEKRDVAADVHVADTVDEPIDAVPPGVAEMLIRLVVQCRSRRGGRSTHRGECRQLREVAIVRGSSRICAAPTRVCSAGVGRTSAVSTDVLGVLTESAASTTARSLTDTWTPLTVRVGRRLNDGAVLANREQRARRAPRSTSCARTCARWQRGSVRQRRWAVHRPFHLILCR